MTHYFFSVLSLGRRHLLTAVCALAALGAAAWGTVHCHAQIDPTQLVLLAIYEGDVEVGRAYRDMAGPRYTEHWVLYPNYTFDESKRPGKSIRIVAHPGQGYQSVEDFLDRVPFPPGSRYVVAWCQEFDELPVKE